MRLILASASPQRREILASLGFAFEVCPSEIDERDRGPAEQVARDNALRKAQVVHAGRDEDIVVLGVDTLVVVDRELWGKPADEVEARAMLARLGGRTHEVVSGFALLRGRDVREGTATTRVTFSALDDATLDWYVRSGEWRGRAGGYAIQGRAGALVERIDGDYLNVVGLPVAALAELWPALIAQEPEKNT